MRPMARCWLRDGEEVAGGDLRLRDRDPLLSPWQPISRSAAVVASGRRRGRTSISIRNRKQVTSPWAHRSDCWPWVFCWPSAPWARVSSKRQASRRASLRRATSSCLEMPASTAGAATTRAITPGTTKTRATMYGTPRTRLSTDLVTLFRPKHTNPPHCPLFTGITFSRWLLRLLADPRSSTKRLCLSIRPDLVWPAEYVSRKFRKFKSKEPLFIYFQLSPILKTIRKQGQQLKYWTSDLDFLHWPDNLNASWLYMCAK